jgi:hypothetical protein
VVVNMIDLGAELNEEETKVLVGTGEELAAQGLHASG